MVEKVRTGRHGNLASKKSGGGNVIFPVFLGLGTHSNSKYIIGSGWLGRLQIHKNVTRLASIFAYRRNCHFLGSLLLWSQFVLAVNLVYFIFNLLLKAYVIRD